MHTTYSGQEVPSLSKKDPTLLQYFSIDKLEFDGKAINFNELDWNELKSLEETIAVKYMPSKTFETKAKVAPPPQPAKQPIQRPAGAH